MNGEALELALEEHDRRSLGEVSTISFANLDVRPYPHQQRMLDALMVERDRHDRHRNLVVAATGTGKTVVAALDYRQLLDRYGRAVAAVRRSPRRDPRASRSLPTERSCGAATSARSSAAGRVARGHHVFAMIQSLRRFEASEHSPERLRRRRRRRVPPRGGRQLRPAAQPSSATRAAWPDGDA